ncbi:MAG: HDOD domain-containing protein [Calditrichaeota bacterium]|nr:HDOD domain-containing protein [Calditrichota bacterium]
MKNREELLAQLREIKTLPTLPDTATKVIQMSQDPDVSPSELALTVEKDPSIATRLLKLVNSPYFGVRGSVTSIQQALVFLGVSNLRNLVLSSSVMDLFSQDGEVGSFSRKQLWIHSMATAVVAREIAKHTRSADPEVAFTAGLIHDVGKVVIDRHFHEEFERIVALMETYQVPMMDAETAVIGLTHAEIGMYLAERWSLPLVLQEAVGFHHDPRYAKHEPKLAALVGYADHVARLLRRGNGGGVDPKVNGEFKEMLGMCDTTFESYCSQFRETVVEQVDALINMGK